MDLLNSIDVTHCAMELLLLLIISIPILSFPAMVQPFRAMNAAAARRSHMFTFACIARWRPSVRNFSSVSANEVRKFSGMDRDWWDPQTNLLIPMNTIRVKYITTLCQAHFPSRRRIDGSDSGGEVERRPLHGLHALDIGCGGGLLSESLARLGAQTVTGIDPSHSLVAVAQEHAQLDARTRMIDYRGGCTAEDLVKSGGEARYDIVFLLEVIEHATDVDSLFQAASALLQPDGLLFVSTINRTIKSYFLTIVGAECLLRYLPVGTHDWNRYLSPREVQPLVATAGLEQLDVSGMVLSRPPLFGNWDWKLDPSDTDVNWIGAYRKKATSR
jgi:2-polyprenyl-6-hydroxyphenyl methylase / 3-demethylubiquinone-9 3-methyltransferase